MLAIYEFGRHSLQPVEFQTAQKVVQAILTLEEKERMQTVALMVSWWEARNKINAGERRRETHEITYMAAQLVQDIQSLLPQIKEKTISPKKRWTPPPAAMFKVNIDGAYLGERKSGGWGFVLRDQYGHAVLAGAEKLEVVHDALCAEAQAGLTALQAVVVHGMDRIQLETDSTCLVSALKSVSYDQAAGGIFFKELRDMMHFHFDHIEVLFAPRTCNFVAHELARSSLGWDSDRPVVWTDPLPFFVTNLVDRDRADPMFNE